MTTAKLLSAAFIGSALLTAPAFAQNTPGGPQMDTQKGQFVTEQSSNQWLGSKMIGLNVYDPQDNKIGDISQILLDHNGNVDAVVIGVGGFLGVGEKNVALPFKSLQWVSQQTAAMKSKSTTAGSNAPATTTGSSASSTSTTTKSSTNVATEPPRVIRIMPSSA